MARRHKPNKALMVTWWSIVAVSGIAVLLYARKHPGAGAALFAAWLMPGVPPPGPLGACCPPGGWTNPARRW